MSLKSAVYDGLVLFTAISLRIIIWCTSLVYQIFLILNYLVHAKLCRSSATYVPLTDVVGTFQHMTKQARHVVLLPNETEPCFLQHRLDALNGIAMSVFWLFIGQTEYVTLHETPGRKET